jgi:tetratricopeptide (TPR) repeat protein
MDKSLDQARQRFKAAICEDPLLSVEDKEALSKDSFFSRYIFYHLITESFRHWFPQVDAHRWSRVTQGCFFSFLFVRCLDDIIDAFPAENLLPLQRRALSYHAQAQRCFADVFPKDAAFWPMLSTVYDRYFKTMSREQQLRRLTPDWTLEAYLQHAADKACMVAVIPIVLRNLADSRFPFKEVELSLLQYHIALQIIDDLSDLVEDIAAKRPTYYFQQLQNVLNQHGIEIDPSRDSELLKRYLYVSGVASSGYEQAIECLEKAITALPSGASDEYTGFLRSQIVACRRKISLVGSLVATARDKAWQQKLGASVAAS